MRHRQNRTPLWVSVVAALTVLVATTFLFGGTSRADEAQSAAEIQSSSITTTQSSGEAQSSSTANTDQSSGAITTATTTDNDTQPANGEYSCTPQDVSPGEIEATLKTLDGSLEYTAYEAVEFSISLTLEEGHCAGDAATITVPSELGTDGDFAPIPMTTPEGVTIGYATYHSDHTVTVKLTSEVEVPGRANFHASAWWRVHMSSVLIPGETRELIWKIDGIVRRTVIKVGTCDGCSHPGVRPSKWGSVDGSTQRVTVVLPTATHDNQSFTVTDTLTSPGQSFACDQLLAGRVGVYSSAGNWGQPQYIRFEEPDIVRCSSDKATVNVKLNAGEKARFELNIDVSSTDPGPWTDSAAITSQDKSWEVSAKITRRESGGNAGFDTTPAPTPSPEPTPSVTPEPSPSPSATPSASPTPSPTTPAPSTEPGPTPKPTPSATKGPSPTTPAKLAVTGASGSVVTEAVALLTLGGIALRARRLAARSED